MSLLTCFFKELTPQDAICGPSECPIHRNGGAHAESTLGDNERGVPDNSKSHPSQAPLSSTRGKRGWRAMLATQSRDKTSQVMSQAREALPLASER